MVARGAQAETNASRERSDAARGWGDGLGGCGGVGQRAADKTLARGDSHSAGIIVLARRGRAYLFHCGSVIGLESCWAVHRLACHSL